MTDDDESLDTPHRHYWREDYLGLELKPYTGRPGAMDCYELPSRFGDRLHYRDGSIRDMKEKV